tara:strand:+ start:2502 stop:3200 length:699 start_codon:yes stop_codon:yes gene_type:complete
MEIIEEVNNTLVCDKGNMLLHSYLKYNIKTYKLRFSINNIDTSKINLTNFLSHNIWELLDKINPDLIEKIHILKIYNDDAADILILFKHIAKEIGIKQKYIIFYTKRTIDYQNNSLFFTNQDINLIDETLVKQYLESINLDIKKYESILYNFGTIKISLTNTSILELFNENNGNNGNNENNENNGNKIFNTDLETHFQLIMKDKLPIYMEDLIGLLIKKIFYNLKVFIDNLN